MHAERSNFRVGVHRLRAATLVVPTGEIDLATRDRFHCSLKPFAGDLVIDLAGVTYMDSSAISVLVMTHKRLKKGGGSIALRDPQPNVRVALELGGLREWIVQAPLDEDRQA